MSIQNYYSIIGYFSNEGELNDYNVLNEFGGIVSFYSANSQGYTSNYYVWLENSFSSFTYVTCPVVEFPYVLRIITPTHGVFSSPKYYLNYSHTTTAGQNIYLKDTIPSDKGITYFKINEFEDFNIVNATLTHYNGYNVIDFEITATFQFNNPMKANQSGDMFFIPGSVYWIEPRCENGEENPLPEPPIVTCQTTCKPESLCVIVDNEPNCFFPYKCEDCDDKLCVINTDLSYDCIPKPSETVKYSNFKTLNIIFWTLFSLIFLLLISIILTAILPKKNRS